MSLEDDARKLADEFPKYARAKGISQTGNSLVLEFVTDKRLTDRELKDWNPVIQRAAKILDERQKGKT